MPSTPGPAALRRTAEARVKNRRATIPPPAGADLKRLQYELELHQVELESQNQSLVESQVETQAALARYTQLYDFAPVGYLSLQPDGGIRQLNLAAATLLGAERSRLVRQHLGQFVGPADRAALADFLKRVFGGQNQACEVTLAEGVAPPRVVRLEAVSTPSGRECQAVMTDITQRQRADEALRAETARRRILFEQLPDGIVIIDPPTARFLEFNSAAHRQLGYSREEFARLTLHDVEAEETDAETKAHIAEAIEAGQTDFQTLHRTRQGEIRNIHVTSQLVNVQGQVVQQCVFRDITARKRAEDEITRQAALIRSLLDSLPDIVFFKNTEGVYLHKR